MKGLIILGLAILLVLLLAPRDGARSPAGGDARRDDQVAASIRGLGYGCDAGAALARVRIAEDGAKTYRVACGSGQVYTAIVRPDGSQALMPGEPLN